MPVAVVALVPAVLLEAVVLAVMLRLSGRRALWISLRANLRSTIVGVVLAIAVDLALVTLTESAGLEPTRTSVSLTLLPLFFLTWWIEHYAVARLAPEADRRRVLKATGIANLLSYCAMFAFVWALLPAQTSFAIRNRINDASSATVGTRVAITEFWAANGRLPVSLQELPDWMPAQTQHAITLEPMSQLSVRLSAPDIPELHGKHLIYTPVIVDASMEWQCSSPDIMDRYLPVYCRADSVRAPSSSPLPGNRPTP